MKVPQSGLGRPGEIWHGLGRPGETWHGLGRPGETWHEKRPGPPAPPLLASLVEVKSLSHADKMGRRIIIIIIIIIIRLLVASHPSLVETGGD